MEAGELAPRKPEFALLGMVQGQVRSPRRQALARAPEKLAAGEQLKRRGTVCRPQGRAGLASAGR